ncbi:hypothetical protein [Frateuria defendens]|nr:hypothetical protein [Frateuria defendens]
MGKPTGRTQRVTRYDLTEKGKQYFHESQGGYSKPKEGGAAHRPAWRR